MRKVSCPGFLTPHVGSCQVHANEQSLLFRIVCRRFMQHVSSSKSETDTGACLQLRNLTHTINLIYFTLFSCAIVSRVTTDRYETAFHLSKFLDIWIATAIVESQEISSFVDCRECLLHLSVIEQ